MCALNLLLESKKIVKRAREARSIFSHLGDVHQVRVFRVGIQAQQKSVEHDAQHYRCLKHVRLDQGPCLLFRRQYSPDQAGRDSSVSTCENSC